MMALSAPQCTAKLLTPTSTFESHHPIAHKVAVVKTLMSRAEALSSSGTEQVQEEKEVITGPLKENGYPSSFIYKHSCPSSPRPDREKQRRKTTLTLPTLKHALCCGVWVAQ